MQIPKTVFGYLWALPYSVIGLAIGTVGLLAGGRVQLHSGVLEFHSGLTRWFVTCLPGGDYVLAFTLGHTVLGQTIASLEISRSHERIHVRQYECWGPFMGPAYLASSLWLWFVGADPYRDNPFEREAYDSAR